MQFKLQSPTRMTTAISLFSGCGGDTLGLEKAGFKVIAFNENKQVAINTHLENFPSSVLLRDTVSAATDITKVSDASFEPYTGKVSIVFAGFPCQGFSKAGKKNSGDPRNQLFRQFVRVAKIVKPDFVIGENVPGLTKMKSGPKDEDPMMLELIEKAFLEIGYTLTYRVLEATDFGVPQKRKRILLVGYKDPSFDAESFWADVNSQGSQKPVPLLRSFVTNTMEGAYLIPAGSVPEEFYQYALPVAQDADPTDTPHPYIALKTNEKLLSCSKRASPVHSEVIDLDRPSKTIICTYDHQPRLLVGLKKPDGTAYVRCLVPDELKQIQGFPSDFTVTGHKKDKVTQIGNAVPPPLIEVIASQLRKKLVVSIPKKAKPAA